MYTLFIDLHSNVQVSWYMNNMNNNVQCDKRHRTLLDMMLTWSSLIANVLGVTHHKRLFPKENGHMTTSRCSSCVFLFLPPSRSLTFLFHSLSRITTIAKKYKAQNNKCNTCKWWNMDCSFMTAFPLVWGHQCCSRYCNMIDVGAW